MIVNGFCKVVFKELPMEFAVEAQKLLGVSASEGIGRLRGEAMTACPFSKITNLHANVARQRDPPRRRPDGERRARSTRSWARTARASRTLAHVLAGRPGYTVTQGKVLYKGKDLLAMAPEDAGPRGRLPRVPVPGRDPGRLERLLPEGRGQRRPQAPRAARATTRSSSSRSSSRRRSSSRSTRTSSSAPSTRASRAARRSATRSSRWRCSTRRSRSSTRRTRASTSTRCGSSPAASTSCARRSASMIVVTHYQRLLNYIVPGLPPRARRGPHRALRRQGARARARGEGLRLAREGAARGRAVAGPADGSRRGSPHDRRASLPNRSARRAAPREPGWLAELRRDALRPLRASSASRPATKNEARGAPPRAVAGPDRRSTPSRRPARAGEGAARLVNGRMPALPRRTCPRPRAAGLKDVLAQEPESAEPHLADRTASSSNAFAALNTALFEDGAFVSRSGPGAVVATRSRSVFDCRRRLRAPRSRHPRVPHPRRRRAARRTIVETYVGTPGRCTSRTP